MNDHIPARIVVGLMLCAVLCSAACNTVSGRETWRSEPSRNFPATWQMESYQQYSQAAQQQQQQQPPQAQRPYYQQPSTQSYGYPAQGQTPAQTYQYQPPAQSAVPAARPRYNAAAEQPAAGAAAGSQWQELDIERYLAEPGVKLVAVDFYATWCRPCMDAIPKWNELHRAYRRLGLRLVVVSVQSEGTCARPPDWNPDRVVCDFDGSIAARWQAGNLPQSFLWSWQGNLLVSHGQVEQVGMAVEQYLMESPRLLVQDPVDQQGRPLEDGAALRVLLRSEFTRAAKFDVVADEDEKRRLSQIRRESYNAAADEQYSCRLGEEVSANSLLKTTVVGGGPSQWLVLEILSAEKGCLVASARVPIDQGDYGRAVIEAVDKLVKSLTSRVAAP